MTHDPIQTRLTRLHREVNVSSAAVGVIAGVLAALIIGLLVFGAPLENAPAQAGAPVPALGAGEG